MDLCAKEGQGLVYDQKNKHIDLKHPAAPTKACVNV
jgi:hypothetical protein